MGWIRHWALSNWLFYIFHFGFSTIATFVQLITCNRVQIIKLITISEHFIQWFGEYARSSSSSSSAAVFRRKMVQLNCEQKKHHWIWIFNENQAKQFSVYLLWILCWIQLNFQTNINVNQTNFLALRLLISLNTMQNEQTKHQHLHSQAPISLKQCHHFHMFTLPDI